MKVVSGRGSLDRGPRGPKALAIGVFDGVHRGHKKILKVLCRIARQRGMLSAVVTFETHPTRTLSRKDPVLHLASLSHKLLLLEREGVDVCYVIDFTPSFAGLDPEAFIKNILIDKIGMRALVVGEDFVFGRKACGDVALLGALSRRFGFTFKAVPHLKVRREAVSSTLIRRLITEGDLARAAALCGRPVSIFGKVVAGEGRGRTLGFPTANVATQHEALLPDGIYASRACCCGRWRRAVAYIGTKPTFSKDRASRSVEVHIFGFKRNILGRSLEIEFLKKIRSDRKFPDAAALVAQMREDARAAKKFLKHIF